MDQGFVKDANYYVTSVVSALTAFATWRMLRFSYHIYQKKQDVKLLEETQVFGVEELKGRGSNIKDAIIVRGSAGTADGRQVERSLGWGKTERLALQLKFTEEMYSNDSFNLKKNNYVLNLREALKSCKIEGSNRITLWSQTKDKQKHEIELKNFDKKDFSKALEILEWKQQKRSLSLAEHINIILLGFLRTILMADNKDASYIRGVEIGKRDVEAGLKVGASISILGKIGFTVDGEMILEVHKILKDRLSEIEGLKDQIDVLISKRNIWLFGSVLGCIYLGRRAFKYVKKNNIKVPLINP